VTPPTGVVFHPAANPIRSPHANHAGRNRNRIVEIGYLVISGPLNRLQVLYQAEIVFETFTVQDFGQLRLNTGATLTVYTKDDFVIIDFGEINVNTADWSRLTINHLCNEKFELGDSSLLYAAVVAPYAQLYIRSLAQFYGTFKGKEVKAENFGQLHTVSSSTGEQILP